MTATISFGLPGRPNNALWFFKISSPGLHASGSYLKSPKVSSLAMLRSL